MKIFLENWPSYLIECGLTADPFQRSQWNNDPSRLRDAFGLNNTGASMKFNLSAGTKHHFYMVTKLPRTGKDQINVSAVSSLPGGGKTRLLLELLELLPSTFDALYYTTFDYKSQLFPKFDTMRYNDDTEKSIDK